MLMDELAGVASTLDGVRVWRVHSYEFMQDVHRRLAGARVEEARNPPPFLPRCSNLLAQIGFDTAGMIHPVSQPASQPGTSPRKIGKTLGIL